MAFHIGSVTREVGEAFVSCGSASLPHPFEPSIVFSHSAVKVDANLPRQRQRSQRAKVLAETRRLLAEKSLNHFCVRRVADECALTVQTIHNNFGARHELLASAINEHTMLMDRSAHDHSTPATMFLSLGKLYYQCALETPDFLYEMVTAAFSSKWPIMELLQPYSTKNKANFLHAMAGKKLLRRFVDPEMLANQITRLNTICVYDWSHHKNSAELFKQLSSGIGLLLLGALHESAAPEIEQWLDDAL